MRADEDGSQPEHEAIDHREIRGASPGAIADQQLMFKQERLSRDASRTTRAEQFHQGDEQMDRQDEQIAHDWLITTSANLHNVALGSESCQTLTNSPPTGGYSNSLNFSTLKPVGLMMARRNAQARLQCG